MHARNKQATGPAQQCKTLSVPKAGMMYFDMGRTASYAAVKRGEIPSIRIGSQIRVPVAALERMIEQAGVKKDSAE
jgi:hypothetical protein